MHHDQNPPGTLHPLIFKALARGGELHGYEIAKQIEEQTGGVLRFDMASLYPMLHRLERKSWVKAEWQTLPNGRRRRCYRLTASGRKQIVPLRAQWRAFFQALQSVTGFQNA